MPTAANGLETPRAEWATTWDSQTQFGAQVVARTSGIQQGLPPLGVDASSQFQRAPTPRYGYPSGVKGAIYALDPNNHAEADVLYFSRYPESLTKKIEAILASDAGPGRSYPVFQQLGARGMQLSTEIWFCDAFIWSQKLADSVPDRSSGHIRAWDTLAHTAEVFFECYMLGHDGTGVALPPADLFLHWGGAKAPIPIVIKSVSMRGENYTSEGMAPRESGVPQVVTVQLEMEVNVPLRVVNPFKPKQPAPGKPGKSTMKKCPNSGFLSDGSPFGPAGMGQNRVNREVARQRVGDIFPLISGFLPAPDPRL